PNVPDTDGGGVNDGPEVVNGTDPLDPSDDIPFDIAGGKAFGCAASNSGGGNSGGSPAGPLGMLLVLGLAWSVRRRRRSAVAATFLGLALLIGLPSAGNAQGFDAQQFQPAVARS